MAGKKKLLCVRGHNLSETRKYSSGGHPYCTACRQEYYAKNQRTPKAKIQRTINARKHWLKASYNFTETDYTNLVKLHDNKCAICFTDRPRHKSHKWAIDHDHITGKVRGILCHRCNMALGGFKDSTSMLKSAIVYLESHKECSPKV